MLILMPFFPAGIEDYGFKSLYGRQFDWDGTHRFDGQILLDGQPTIQRHGAKQEETVASRAAGQHSDFPGLGPHSFRRANITWRQEVGGSSIEASKIAGHSTVRTTEEYTKIQLTLQDELTRRIQQRLADVGEKHSALVQ